MKKFSHRLLKLWFVPVIMGAVIFAAPSFVSIPALNLIGSCFHNPVKTAGAVGTCGQSPSECLTCDTYNSTTQCCVPPSYDPNCQTLNSNDCVVNNCSGPYACNVPSLNGSSQPCCLAGIPCDGSSTSVCPHEGTGGAGNCVVGWYSYNQCCSCNNPVAICGSCPPTPTPPSCGTPSCGACNCPGGTKSCVDSCGNPSTQSCSCPTPTPTPTPGGGPTPTPPAGCCYIGCGLPISGAGCASGCPCKPCCNGSNGGANDFCGGICPGGTPTPTPPPCIPSGCANPGGCGNWSVSCSNGCGGTSTSSGCNGGCGYSCVTPATSGLNRKDICGNLSHSDACNPAWFQAEGGDVHANGPLSVGLVPSSYSPSYPTGLGNQTAYYNYFNPGQYGVVSSASTISIVNSSGSTVLSQINPGSSSGAWVIQNYPGNGAKILTNPQYDFNYFWNKYQSSICKTSSPSGASGNINNGDINIPNSSKCPPSGNSIGFVDLRPTAGCSIIQTQNLGINGNNKSAVVFVESPSCPSGVNLTFNPGSSVSIDNTGNSGSKGNAIVWIVSGNVTIDSSVAQLDGNWIVQGTWTELTSCSVSSSSCSDTQLRINGSVASYGGIALARHITDTTNPAEVIIYNPNIENLLPILGESNYSWKEVSP